MEPRGRSPKRFIGGEWSGSWVVLLVVLILGRSFPVGKPGENSPDNTVHSATDGPAFSAGQHNAEAFGTPKMPGEPKRVQPSRDTDLKSKNEPT